MCGIVGFTGKKNLRTLSRMLATVEHRGRDGRTLFYADGVHLGMNRLAIIDLSPRLYPMVYKQYTLVFNGEIYNYRELKIQLSELGVRFTTDSDAEVILPLYHKYGPKAFSMLEGMFAISVYDNRKKQIIFARDKSGEKPLYIMQYDDGIVFASEIKALLSFDDTRKTLNYSGLSQYLRQGFVFAPDTLVGKIQKILPSTCMTYDVVTRHTRVTTYWSPQVRTGSVRPTQKLTPALSALVEQSVRLRLAADVPVGCFLSGGVDSSLIAYFASREKPNIHTYSVSFPGHELHDESDYASFAAKRLGTRHTIVACTAKRVSSLFSNIGTYIDEPIMDPAVLPTLLMSEEARKNVKVVLTGEGADELFGGYDRYRNQLAVERFRKYLGKIPHILDMLTRIPFRRAQSVSHDLFFRYYPQRVWNDRELTSLLTHPIPIMPRHKYLLAYGAINPLVSMQLTDFRGYLAEQLLMKIDKSTMAYNLEARAPYLDTHIIEFALNLPVRDKLRFAHGKYILKKVAEQYFPKSFVWRPKHGFDVPLREWFRQELRDHVMQSIDDVEEYGNIFNVGYYKHIIDEHMSQRSDHSSKIWSMVVLINWIKAHNLSV